jgi:hypothetical protein
MILPACDNNELSLRKTLPMAHRKEDNCYFDPIGQKMKKESAN